MGSNPKRGRKPLTYKGVSPKNNVYSETGVCPAQGYNPKRSQKTPAYKGVLYF